MRVLTRHHKSEKWIILSRGVFKGEAHLQNILFEDPSVIPIEDISVESAPIKLMLREVFIQGSGSSDLLGIDIKGNVYIIETKLASNPEVKRKVIGQILDYASSLYEQGFDWLDEVVRKQKQVSIFEYFEGLNDPRWDKESFEQTLRNSLKSGKFKLIIAVDEVNQELKRIIGYMRNVLGVEIYALELQYFEDKSGCQILVPNIYSGIAYQSPSPTPKWNWEKFRNDAKEKVDDVTLLTLEKLFKFASDLGRVDFGKGQTYGTFKVYIPYKSKEVTLFTITSTGKNNWFSFKEMIEKGISKTLIAEYIGQLKTLGFELDEEKHIEAYPTFETRLLNDEEKFEKFKEYTREFREKLI